MHQIGFNVDDRFGIVWLKGLADISLYGQSVERRPLCAANLVSAETFESLGSVRVGAL